MRLPGGNLNWVTAFGTAMEGILRDGEDMSVLLPYEAIRRHVERLEPLLHRVRTPRLFLLHAGDSVEKDADWSSGVFGDPLMSDHFTNPDADLDEFEDILDDPTSAPARLLLYKAYHTLVDIITEYYRPTSESSKNELVARKRLTGLLSELEKVEVERAGTEEPATPKRSSEAAEMVGGETPGKRIKVEVDEESEADAEERDEDEHEADDEESDDSESDSDSKSEDGEAVRQVDGLPS